MGLKRGRETYTHGTKGIVVVVFHQVVRSMALAFSGVWLLVFFSTHFFLSLLASAKLKQRMHSFSGGRGSFLHFLRERQTDKKGMNEWGRKSGVCLV